jgi:hypothetical protein
MSRRKSGKSSRVPHPDAIGTSNCVDSNVVDVLKGRKNQE